MSTLGLCRYCSEKISTGATICPYCGQAAPYSSLPSFDDSEVRLLVKQGKKIQAIKLLREITGWGLKKAKDYVDVL